MTLFRLFLVAVIATVGAYTTVTIANHGMGLYPIFFGDIAEMAWPGQFNLDFLFFLIFSGFWVAWRHEFSVAGLVLGFSGRRMATRPWLSHRPSFAQPRCRRPLGILRRGQGPSRP